MKLSETISKLKVALPHAGAAGADRLRDLPEPADNPGNLQARVYVPATLAAPAPLVVVLHGCTQDAAAYDAGSGWSRLADRHGFALLFPQQTRANNPNLCFNWFLGHDTARGRGEAGSIAAQVAAMRAAYPIDAARVFVTGLSAGGAMASAMLATYPDVFAAGAIIAGLPYGCASGVGEAFECMSGARGGGATGDAVRAASGHTGPWPRVSVWHGTADQTVAYANAGRIVAQWLDVHDLSAVPAVTNSVDGYAHDSWAGARGIVVERYAITGMGHGTPLKPGTAEGHSGTARPHMLDAGISSTDRIAAFFGIASASTGADARTPVTQGVQPAPVIAPPPARTSAASPQKVIEDALRAAGLMR